MMEVPFIRCQLRRIACATVLAGLCLTSAVGGALAEDDGGGMPPSTPLRTGANSPSLNWAGYVAGAHIRPPEENHQDGNNDDAQNDGVTAVAGRWTVPSLTCSATKAYSAVWVGMDGYTNRVVEQVGTQQNCVDGKAVYSAWYELYPGPKNRLAMVVNARDTISAEVRYANGAFQFGLRNLSNGQSFNTTVQQPSAARQSAEWIVEAPTSTSGTILPLANFGTVAFSDASFTIHGNSGSIANSDGRHYPVVMANSDRTIKATPSRLGDDGRSFSVTWHHS